jgi:hypothetical protein
LGNDACNSSGTGNWHRCLVDKHDKHVKQKNAAGELLKRWMLLRFWDFQHPPQILCSMYLSKRCHVFARGPETERVVTHVFARGPKPCL